MIQQNMISELSDANDKWTGSHLSISESSMGHCGYILTPLKENMIHQEANLSEVNNT